MTADRNFNPALDLPLRDIPFTLLAVRPIGFIYYYEFQTEPSVDQYAAAGAALRHAMISQIGSPPTGWWFGPTADVNLDFFRGNEVYRDPVQVLAS